MNMILKEVKKIFLSLGLILGLPCLVGCNQSKNQELINKANQAEFYSPSFDSKKSLQTYFDRYESEKIDMGENFFSNKLNSIGNQKLLVIPIWFSDGSLSSSLKNQVHEDLENAFFGTAGTNWESVASFYSKSSHNALNLTGTVTDWITPTRLESRVKNSFGKLNKNYFNYADNQYDFATTTDNGLYDLFNDVLNQVAQKYGNAFLRDYDQDKDGFIDGVWFVYNVDDYSRLDERSEYYDENYWAYTWTDYYDQIIFEEREGKYYVRKTDLQNNIRNWTTTGYPRINNFAWGSYDFMYASDKKRTLGYELGSPDAHTYIHETGHMMGLDDYYSYADEPNSPMGTVDMMDCNIGDHNGFSKFALGWNKAYIWTKQKGNNVISLKDASTSGEGILIPASDSFNNETAFNEYLYVEYYTPSGLFKKDSEDYYLNGARCFTQNGVRIYHVDARVAYFDEDSGHYLKSPTTKHSFCTVASNTPDYSSNGFGLIAAISSDNDKHYTTTKEDNMVIWNESLFQKGDSFSIQKYSSYFANTDEKLSIFKKNKTWNTVAELGDSSSTTNVQIYVGYTCNEYANIAISF